MNELYDKLSEELARVGWRDLRPHAGRGVLFLWTGDASLVEVAIAVARDDRVEVEGWLESGQLSRPTERQLSDWEAALERPFEYLIVQPFVLARDLSN